MEKNMPNNVNLETFIEAIKFDKDGLIPVVVQQQSDGTVLMMAWMDKESLANTIKTGIATYFSRSRSKQWVKGEESGHIQEVKEISYDCDGDAILLKVDQNVAACHTGHFSCFYNKYELLSEKHELQNENHELVNAETDTDNQNKTGNDCCGKTAIVKLPVGEKAFDPVKIYNNIGDILYELSDVIKDRRDNPKEGSYTNYLFDKGIDKILKKVGEETSEVIIASKNNVKNEMVYEISDLIYHLLVLMAERGVTLGDICNELKGRR